MAQISVSIDKTVDAAYITLSGEQIAETRALSDEINVDLDANGVAVGIEMLVAEAEIPFDRLCREFHVHSTVIDLLRMIGPSAYTFVSSAAAGSSPARRPQHQSALQYAA